MPTAILTSCYVNAHLSSGQQRVEPEDFVPGARELPAVAPEVLSIMRRKAMEEHNRKLEQ